MKKLKLEKHLRSQGCVFEAHGARHDRWINLVNLSQIVIPRHSEIKSSLVIALRRALGVERPTEK